MNQIELRKIFSNYKPLYLKIKEKRELSNKKITIMADYCAEALWLNGRNIDIHSTELPYNLRLLKRELDNWVEDYENMFTIKNMSSTDLKVMKKSNFHKRWVKKGFELTSIIRRLTPSQFNVEYFNEESLMRIKF